MRGWVVACVTDFVTGFEGNAHPYKHNILRMDGKTSIADLPEVQTTMQKMAAPPSEPAAR